MMRAKLSVVIPTLNAADKLPDCLGSLMEGVDAGLIRELIVSDGGSQDATRIMAADVGAIVLDGTASRGAQLARGAEVAKGEWLLFIHADSCLPAGWPDVLNAHFQNGRPAYFRLRFDVEGVGPALVARWANFRSSVFRLPYGDQALLISRADYEVSGGYADIPLMEDVAMARALGAKLVKLPLAITTSADKYQSQGWVKRGARNLSLLVRYLAGADPKRLAEKY